MNKQLLAVMAMAAALPAMAGMTAKEFPARLPVRQAEAPAAAPTFRAPLNPDRGKGTNIFATTVMDYDKGYHFLNMWSETPSRLNKISEILNTDMGDNPDEPDLYVMMCGAWGGDGWYGYKMRAYTFEMWVDSWVKADPETGSYEKLVDMYNNEYGAAWNVTTDLAWNPVDGQMYALQQSDEKNDKGAVTSMISLIDPETGETAEIVKQLDDYYFCFAFDYDGKLAAIRWTYNGKGEIMGTMIDVFDPTDDFYLEKSTALIVDNKAYKINYQNSLTYDYTTGDLWWAACDSEAKQQLVKIDPQTFVTENKGTIGFLEAITGLYIPYLTADSRTAPAQVQNLDFTIDPEGADKVTLTWTNPSKCWNLKKLSSIEEVRIYRDSYDGELAAVIAGGTPGEAMSWTDEGAAKGIHTYYVTACAKKGEKGVPSSVNAFVGRDVPGPVENLTATTEDGKSITLTWDAPTRGDNDGWFDASSLEYTVVRTPGNVDLGTVKENRIVDADMPEAQAYTYIVTSRSVDGVGGSASSDPLLAGQSVLVPFQTEFETKVEADRFTSLDLNGDGHAWDYDLNLNRNRNTMHILLSDYGNDDMLVTPPLALKKGVTYKVSYLMSFGGYGDPSRQYNHHYSFKGGTEPTEEGMKDQYDDMPDYVVKGREASDEVITYFTSPVDGDYYFGFELLTSGESVMWMYVEKFTIQEAPANDMEARKVSSYLVVSNQEDNEFTVEVYNNGSNAQDNYKVNVAYLDGEDTPHVFATLADVPALESHEKAVVTVKGHPEGITGQARIVATVELEGDGNSINDVSDPFNVSVDEADAFNYTITGEVETHSTNVPFQHYNAGYACQTIYTPDMTGIKDMENCSITRLAWEYNGMASFGGTHLDVYLSQTDKPGFEPDGDEWIPVSKPLFSGEIEVVNDRAYAVADLDEAWEFDPEKGIVVTVSKFEGSHADFLMDFRVFDDDWYLSEFHSLWLSSTQAVNVGEALAAKARPMAPVLHLALKGDPSGVEEVVVSGNGTYFYDNASGVLHANGNGLRNVDVYDFSGRKVACVAVAEGQNEVRLNLPAGLYLLKLNEEASFATLKIQVR